MGLLDKLFRSKPPKRPAQPPRQDYIVYGRGPVPLPLALVHPQGNDGAVRGMIGPAPDNEEGFDLRAPLEPDRTYLAFLDGGVFTLDFDRRLDDLDLSVLADAECNAKLARAEWRVGVSFVVPEEGPLEDPAHALSPGLLLCDVIAERGDGAIFDLCSFRALLPGSWKMGETPYDVDPREHFNVHCVDEGDHLWFHSHGMVKLGKPEIEMRTSIRNDDVALVFLDILAGAAMTDFAPGHTTGERAAPLYVVEGVDEDDHWEDTPVLALVDDRNDPRSLADRGIRAMMPEEA